MIIKTANMKPAQRMDLVRETDDEGDIVPCGEFDEVLTRGEELKKGKELYGPAFEGFSELPRIAHLIPVFRDYFLTMYANDRSVDMRHAITSFIGRLAPGVEFYPPLLVLGQWEAEWKELSDYMAKVPTVAPDEGYLDQGIRTLAGELLSDAHATLRKASTAGDEYAVRDLLNMKRYVAGVLASITTMVHGKAKIMLQASSEKRESASFVADLLQKATSGKLSMEELERLKATIKPA